MKKILLCILTIVLILVGSAYSAERKKLHPLLITPKGEVQLFFEPGSVEIDNSVFRYKIHLLFTPSHNMPFEENGVKHVFDEPVSKVVDTIEMSCGDFSYASVKKEFFGIDDNLLWVYEPIENLEYEPVNQENISGSMYNLLCQNQKFTNT